MLHGHPPVGTKACIPRLSPLLVARPRLENLLGGDARRPVTLVCGPPGSGKTTLLATALGPTVESGAELPAAWLCLDDRDNDCRRLIALLTAALGFEDEDELGRSSRDSVFDLVDDLLGQVAAHADRQVLVLDDVHELRSEAALGVLGHLVLRAPPQLDLVLSSRADPPVGLEALRLDGRLGEIRNAELAFSQPETMALLVAHEVDLDRADACALWTRTQGWAAGLRLAACALQTDPDPRRFVRSASRTEAVVSDYLLRELLVHQDEAVQWFLLRTSVAERLTVKLAEILSEDARSAEHVADLERSGVLVVDQADDRYFRYHALFGALLQARLQRHDAELARELHGRVARWWLERDGVVEAQHHARAAEDWVLLGQLVAWRWVDATLDGCLADEDLMPPDLEQPVVTATPGLAFLAAAEACRRGEYETADFYRGALDELVDSSQLSFTPWENEHLLLDVTFGCAFGADDRAIEAAAALQRADAGDRSATGLRRFGVLRGAELALDAGRIDEAGLALADLTERPDGGWVGAEAAALLALLHAASGQPIPAEALANRHPLSERTWPTPLVEGAVPVAAALTRALRGEPRGAAEVLATAEHPPGGFGSRTVRTVERAVQAGLAATPGRVVALDAATADHPLAQRALLALGVLDVTTSEGRPVPVGGPLERSLAAARARLALGDLGRADQGLEPGLTGDPQASHPRSRVEALVIAAVAAHARGDQRAAWGILTEALGLMAASGVAAPLLQHGSLLVPVLERHRSELGEWMATGLVLLDRIRPRGEGTLVEALTDREMEVLVHLPTLMSNAEIASGLHLSVNTVKTHLKALYRKLGVAGRREAVVRGRELELI